MQANGVARAVAGATRAYMVSDPAAPVAAAAAPVSAGHLPETGHRFAHVMVDPARYARSGAIAIVYTATRPEDASAENIKAYFMEFEALLLHMKGRPFSLLLDTRRMNLGLRMDLIMAHVAFLNKMKPILSSGSLIGTAIVTQSMGVRMAINAFLALYTPHAPLELLDTEEIAYVWLEGVLRTRITDDAHSTQEEDEKGETPSGTAGAEMTQRVVLDDLIDGIVASITQVDTRDDQWAALTRGIGSAETVVAGLPADLREEWDEFLTDQRKALSATTSIAASLSP